MPYSMQLTEQTPNDPPRMGALQLAIIPVPPIEVKVEYILSGQQHLFISGP